MHERLAEMFPSQRTAQHQITYRGIAKGRDYAVVQMYFPERRLYFPELDKVGGSLAELQTLAADAGLVIPSRTAIEWPDPPDERIQRLLELIEARVAPMFQG